MLDTLGVLIDEGRLAHAYLIQGDPLTDGKRFAVALVTELFARTGKGTRPQVAHRVETRIHPDVFWVEPTSKLRQIVKDSMSAALKRVNEKSFEGGWKVVVFLGAERMNPTVGNQLLKTLEEPPPDTLILLVTEVPEQLLTTLRSRTQCLIAPRGAPPIPEWQGALMEILHLGPPTQILERLLKAAYFRDFLNQAAKEAAKEAAAAEALDAAEAEVEEVDEAVANARESAARRQMNRQVMALVETWYRDLLVFRTTGSVERLVFPESSEVIQQQAASLQPKDIMKLLENTRTIAARLETNLPVQVAFECAVI